MEQTGRRHEMLKRLKRILLDILGDIKIYRYPFFMIYDPTTFRIKGHHTRQAMDLIEPGCIIMRKYVNYADGFFIPGKFSHSGIYVGEGKVVHAVSGGVEFIDIIDFLRCDGFGILMPKDKEAAARAVERAVNWIGTPYDFDFTDGDDAFYCHELTARCYGEFHLKKHEIRILGFRLKPRYTCDSFLECTEFDPILENIPQ